MGGGAGPVGVERFSVRQRADGGALDSHVVNRPSGFFCAAYTSDPTRVEHVVWHVSKGVGSVAHHTDECRLGIDAVVGQQCQFVAAGVGGVRPCDGQRVGDGIIDVYVVRFSAGVSCHVNLVDGNRRVHAVKGVVPPNEVHANRVASPSSVQVGAEITPFRGLSVIAAVAAGVIDTIGGSDKRSRIVALYVLGRMAKVKTEIVGILPAFALVTETYVVVVV